MTQTKLRREIQLVSALNAHIFILSVLHLNFTYLSGFNVLLLMIDGDFVTALVGNNTNDLQVASEKSFDNSGQAVS